MFNFRYYTPTQVYFGKGEELHVGDRVKEQGARKVLLHYGGHSAEKSGLLDRVRKSLKDAGVDFVELGGVHANPDLEMVRRGVKLGLDEGVDFVLAVGGGSVIDSSKAISHGIANPDIDEWEFQKKRAVPEGTLKKGCILTLAAAGSEMSNSCVITNEETGEKRGFNSDFNRMNFAIENPELTYTVPAYQTGCGAVDITMHTMERFFDIGEDTPLTDALAEAVMRENNRAAKICIKEPDNYVARATMMWASSVAHNDLTGLGRKFMLQLHQLEHEISGMYPQVAHGAGLAALFRAWAEFNLPYNLNRWVRFGHNVWNAELDYEHPERTAQAGIDAQVAYYREIGMPTNLQDLDPAIKESDLPVLAHNVTFQGTRTLTGPKELNEDDILQIFKNAYGK